ncbi:class III lanthionine synthetase LanKC [Actinoplanes sp. NPDC000266]
MTDRPEFYAFPGLEFYEDPLRGDAEEPAYHPVARSTPEGWTRHAQGPWAVLRPLNIPLSKQGWKVHVSATMEDAPLTIEKVWDHCIPRGIAFKYARSPRVAFHMNAKYADRRSSGKLVAIYPSSEEVLENLLHELGDTLDGARGPYILSDLRWRNGPLYLRYGGFVERWCIDESGDHVPAIEHPNGSLVPDERGVQFRVPDWVHVPNFIAAAIGQPEAEVEFPFTVDKALQFSNGGGLYRATDQRNGRSVVLREARPYAGLDRSGKDAVERLLAEQATLTKINGHDIGPKLIEYRTAWEHHFLIEEHIDGRTLDEEFTARYPLARHHPSSEVIRQYTTWALDVITQVTNLLSRLHDMGIVYADLHPNNIIVQPNGRIVLVDFEVSQATEDSTPVALGAPGFTSSNVKHGREVDEYALAMLRIYLFLPYHDLISMDASRLDDLTKIIEQRFPLPATFTQDTIALLRRASGGSPLNGTVSSNPDTRHRWPSMDASVTAWHRAFGSIADGILAAATPHRTDRLFPGDPRQFTGMGQINLAHGAAGVLWVLQTLGRQIDPVHLNWLHARSTEPNGPARGLIDGIHGVAWAMQELGQTEHAYTLMKSHAATDDTVRSPAFSNGLSGIALNLLHFSDIHNDDDFRRRGTQIAHRLRDGFEQDRISPRRAGLMAGGAGTALLFTHMYERTADERWLDTAVKALHQDVDLAQYQHGLMALPDGAGRLLPYLAEGTIGLALVAQRYLHHRTDARLQGILDMTDRICDVEFTFAPGLFEGRAGMIYYLSARARSGKPSPESLKQNIAWLGRHALWRENQLIFPGRRLLRLSTDLATGSAGILMSLRTAITGSVGLPFLS